MSNRVAIVSFNSARVFGKDNDDLLKKLELDSGGEIILPHHCVHQLLRVLTGQRPYPYNRPSFFKFLVDSLNLDIDRHLYDSADGARFSISNIPIIESVRTRKHMSDSYKKDCNVPTWNDLKNLKGFDGRSFKLFKKLLIQYGIYHTNFSKVKGNIQERIEPKSAGYDRVFSDSLNGILNNLNGITPLINYLWKDISIGPAGKVINQPCNMANASYVSPGYEKTNKRGFEYCVSLDGVIHYPVNKEVETLLLKGPIMAQFLDGGVAELYSIEGGKPFTGYKKVGGRQLAGM